MGSQTAGSRYPAHDLSVFPDALRGKRILLCTESFGPVNGVSRTTLMLVTHLRANGAVVAVVAPHNHTRQNTFTPSTLAGDAKSNSASSSALPGPDSTPWSGPASSSDPGPFKSSNLDLRLHGYPLPFNPELSVVYPFRLSDLYRRTFGSPPDLIYLASPASLGFQVMLQLRQQAVSNQTPVICNFQTDLAGYCAILFPPPLSDCAVWVFATVQSFLFRHPSVKTIFYPSRFVQRYLDKNGVQTEKMDLVQRGVDTELFHPGKRSSSLRSKIAPDGEIILICVARLAGEKGFDFLAAVAKELDARGIKFRLYIVGGNRNTTVETEVKARFADLVKKEKVIFAGFCFGQELAVAYASADLFLHCSVTETFGLVVLESMASGVPVVARDEGGPSDIVQDGETGYLVPPEDLEGFVDCVARLVRDDGSRRRLGENARRQAEEATWQKINNRVAWRMVDTIEEVERDRFSGQLESEHRQPNLRGKMKRVLEPLILPIQCIVRRCITKTKVVVSLGVISTIWVAVGGCLVFIQTSMWLSS